MRYIVSITPILGHELRVQPSSQYEMTAEDSHTAVHEALRDFNTPDDGESFEYESIHLAVRRLSDDEIFP
jgi:hypothetical protein